MLGNIIILQSKLAPPRLSGTVVRNRLNRLLAGMAEARIITVTAGAGYGKTTFAGQICRHLQRRTVWYRLEPSDMDVIVFVQYLIAGIQEHYPGFGEQTMKRIKSAEQFKNEQRSIWTVFLHEVETCVREPMVVVLDDFHHIQADESIRSAMGILLEHLPETVQLLVISRKTPELDLSRLVAGRQAFEVTENALAFTLPETKALYQEIFDLDLGREALNELTVKTGGWAAGLVLFQYNLKEKTEESIAGQLALLGGGNRAFGRYLEENIIQALPPEVKTFIFKTAILSQLEVSFCNQLLDIENAAELLRQLERRHLFTFSLDEQQQSYQYHHLFRDYLRANLTSVFEPQAVVQLHLRAARIWQQRKDPHEAVAHYLVAGAFKEAGDLLVQHGNDMIMAGRVNQVLDFLYDIPESRRENDPELTFFMGNALFYRGSMGEALKNFEKARCQFTARGDQAGIGLCLSRLATGYYMRNDFVKAEAIYREILPRVVGYPEFYTYCLASLIIVSSRLGKFDEADHYFKEAEAIKEQCQSLITEAGIYTAYGYRLQSGEDYIAALQYADKAVQLARRNKHHHVHALCLRLIASCWIELDEDDKGLAAALDGIAVCERYGTLGAPYAWCHIDAGTAKAKKGAAHEAIAHYEVAQRISREIESDWSEAWATISLAGIRLRMGDLDAAEIGARQALEAMRRTTLPVEIAVMSSVLAWVLIKKDRIDEAIPLIPNLESLPYPNGKIVCWTHMLYAFVDWKCGRAAAATEHLGKAFDQVPVLKIGRDMMNPKGWMVPFLAELYAEGKHQQKIVSFLSLIKPEDIAQLESVQQKMNDAKRRALLPLLQALGLRDTKPLYVHCFGPFKLLRDGREIASKQWVSAKARQLCKYLAFYADKGFIAKDKLLELLWPDQDPVITGKRLHVALTTIRKVLEPELARGQKSCYLERENEAYQLHLGDHGFLDVAVFDQALAKAEKADEPEAALVHLLAAEQCYTGDLFEEENYTEWCMAVRAEYKEKYLLALRKIADNYERTGRSEECIVYLNKVLKADEYAEDIYCRLMALYSETGNRFMAVKTYERCKQRLEKELQCPLSEETQTLYQQIVLG